MSRFLHRPMFRRGGSTGEGITSGLRPGYNRGRVVNPGGYSGDEPTVSDILDTEYELYFKADGTLGKRKKKSTSKVESILDWIGTFPGGDFDRNYAEKAAADAKKKSILDFIPKKVERKEPTSLGSGLPGGREEEVEEEAIDKYSALPGGREEEVEEEVIDKYSALPGGGPLEEDKEETSSGTLDQLMLGDPPELPKSTAGADFWLNLGTNILAQPGGRPILQTLGTAGREPLARYQQQRGQEDMLKYQHAQAERAFNLEIYKAMTDEDKINLKKEIDYLMSEHGLSKEEALAQAMPKYRKSMNPADIERQAKEAEREKIYRAAEALKSDLSAEEGVNVSLPQAIVINEFYDQAHAQDPIWEYDDIPFIDKITLAKEWRDLNKKVEDWVSPEGNIAIPPDLQNDYNEGLYYVDHFNGDVYKVGPGSTELIKIKLDEIKIN